MLLSFDCLGNQQETFLLSIGFSILAEGFITINTVAVHDHSKLALLYKELMCTSLFIPLDGDDSCGHTSWSAGQQI